MHVCMYVAFFTQAFSAIQLLNLHFVTTCLRPISLEPFILPVRGWEHRLFFTGLHTFCYSAVTSQDIQFNGPLAFHFISGAILTLTNFCRTPKPTVSPKRLQNLRVGFFIVHSNY